MTSSDNSSLQRPAQAVILAGGRGTRLAPLTDTRPKPMIEFAGKPFVEYLVEWLRGHGLKRIVMLLGYLPDVITDYFGDGSRFGVEITYSTTAVENDTGKRLQLAAPLLDPVFFLLYCDNYCPVDFTAMWTRFAASDASMLVSVYRNDDDYTKNNVVIGDDGYVAVYDKSRKAPGLRGVDIGFMLLRREVLDLLPDGNISLEAELYPRLVAAHKLLAYVTSHRYYSVGSHERLEFTRTFLARRPAVLLDRDGVLNQCRPKATYVRDWSEWVWLPGALDALRKLHEAGWLVLIITNQAGVARGDVTPEQLEAVHQRMMDEARAAGGEITAVFHCPHGWDEGCECRKPKPGMLFQAQRRYCLDLTRTPFVGDDPRDGEAAHAAGCPFHKVDDDHPLSQIVDELLTQ